MATFTWYTTSQGFRWMTEDGQIVRGPARKPHAKSLGSNRTACGLKCETWPKFWHLEYRPGETSGSCAKCDAVVTNASSSSANQLVRGTI